jgi:hypothetical protein
MLGDRAAPTAWKACPTSPVTRLRGAQDKALTLLFSFDFLEAIEIHEPAPLALQANRGEADFGPLAQDERQKRAEDVAANGFILLMIDGSGVEHGVCRLEELLDLEKFAIPEHGYQRAEVAIGSQPMSPS